MYTLKSVLSNRSTSQGYSTKWDMTKGGANVPGPETYNLTSSSLFSKNKQTSIRKKLPYNVKKFD